MVAATVTTGLKVAISAHGGSGAGQEDALATAVRTRLNAKNPNFNTKSGKRGQLIHGLALLSRYVRGSLYPGLFGRLDEAKLGDIVFELLEVVAKRTKILRNYQDTLDSDSDWVLVCSALWRIPEDGDAPGPEGEGPPKPEADDETWKRWWRHRRCIAFVVGSFSCSQCGICQVCSTRTVAASSGWPPWAWLGLLWL